MALLQRLMDLKIIQPMAAPVSPLAEILRAEFTGRAEIAADGNTITVGTVTAKQKPLATLFSRGGEVWHVADAASGQTRELVWYNLSPLRVREEMVRICSSASVIQPP